MINFLVLLVTFGIWNFWRKDIQILKNHFSHFENEQLDGIIDDEPLSNEKSIRFPVKIIGRSDSNSFATTEGKLMVTVNRDSTNHFDYGDEIILISQYKEVQSPMNPLEFDYKNYLANHHIYHQTYLNSTDYKIIKKHQGNPIIDFALFVRKYLIDRFSKNIPEKDQFNIAVALILGYRSNLSTETLDAFSNTGTIHILSVSGMHVAILFAVMMWFLRRMDQRNYTRILKAVILLLVIWGYAFLTGLAPSILRSAIMLSFLIIGKLLKKDINILNTTLASAFFLLLFDPKMILDIGFQLSYLAVLGIVLIYPLLAKLYKSIINRYLKLIFDCAAISISAQIATAPLALFYFGQFPNYFLLANLLVAIPVTVIMYAGFVLMVSPFDFLNVWLGKLLSFTIDQMFWILSKIDHLPFSNWNGIVFTALMVILTSLSIVLILYAFYWKNKNALWISLVSILLFAFLFAKQQYEQMTYIGFRIYNVRKNIALAFIKDGNVSIISSLDSLNHKNLTYSLSRDLKRFDNWQKISFKHLLMEDSLRMNYRVQNFHLNIQIAEHSEVQNFPTDILIIRKNNKWDFVRNITTINPKLVIFDATNSDLNIKQLSSSLDSLKVPHYTLKNNFAYVWDKETL